MAAPALSGTPAAVARAHSAPALVVLIATLLGGACAVTGGTGDSFTDLATKRDLALGDANGSDLACLTGTPDHCASCSDRCPPASDVVGTERVCVATACDLVCDGEYYDLDGDAKNGCEALDAVIQDSAMSAVAVTLPDVVDDPKLMTNPKNLVEKIYWDHRTHDAAPVVRENGRDDWWQVSAVGPGNPNVTMKACLSIVNFPVDDVLEVCISDLNRTTFDPRACMTVSKNSPSACVQPPAHTDAGAVYYVRVRKAMGQTPTTNGYALFLQH